MLASVATTEHLYSQRSVIGILLRSHWFFSLTDLTNLTDNASFYSRLPPAENVRLQSRQAASTSCDAAHFVRFVRFVWDKIIRVRLSPRMILSPFTIDFVETASIVLCVNKFSPTRLLAVFNFHRSTFITLFTFLLTKISSYSLWKSFVLTLLFPHFLGCNNPLSKGLNFCYHW